MSGRDPEWDYDGGWGELNDTGNDFDLWTSDPVDRTNLGSSWQAGRVARARDGNTWQDTGAGPVRFDQTKGGLTSPSPRPGRTDSYSRQRSIARPVRRGPLPEVSDRAKALGRALLAAENPGECPSCDAPISSSGGCRCS